MYGLWEVKREKDQARAEMANQEFGFEINLWTAKCALKLECWSYPDRRCGSEWKDILWDLSDPVSALPGKLGSAL